MKKVVAGHMGVAQRFRNQKAELEAKVTALQRELAELRRPPGGSRRLSRDQRGQLYVDRFVKTCLSGDYGKVDYALRSMVNVRKAVKQVWGGEGRGYRRALARGFGLSVPSCCAPRVCWGDHTGRPPARPK